MKILSLKDVQQIELKILLDFQSFCNDNGLRFYLCCGTMLGAARHKGFIPWDDDIDVMMPRTDYIRLFKLIKINNPFLPDYDFYSPELGNANYPFSKLVYLKSHVEQEYLEDESISHIWIDIMPVDGLPNDPNKIKKIYRKIRRIRKMLMLCLAKPGKATTFSKKVAKMILTPISKLVGAKRWCKLMNDISMRLSFDESDFVGVITWGLYNEKEACYRKKFEKEVLVEFEGYNFPAISCWNEYLSNIYGDYMQLPPEEKRKIHLLKAWLD